MINSSRTTLDESHRFARHLIPFSTLDDSPAISLDAEEWPTSATSLPADATTIEGLRDRAAFVLLGELGVGKTWLFEHEAARLPSADPRCLARFVRLGEYGDIAELERDVFKDRDVTRALAASRTVYLFLDALDQGIVQMSSLAPFLERSARRLRASTLRLRVSSRMSLQALNLGSNLAAIHSTEPRELVFRIGSLTPEDVVSEATARGIDGTRFMKAVQSRNAEVLASHPLSLDLLLGTYKKAGTLTGDLTELYRLGCHRLCEEYDLIQAEDALVRGPHAYAITTRIAAVSALAGASLIAVGPSSGRPQNSVGIEEVTNFTEVLHQMPFVVTEPAVQSVLKNAHFQSAGGANYRWAHLGMQDFMAAEWIRNRLGPDQIRGLLVHPLDPRGQIRPELEEVAAWLAGMVPEVRDYLLRTQPMVLLTSQAHLGAIADPVALLAALLTPENARRVRWLNVRDNRLGRLRSGTAKELLRPWLHPTGIDRDIQWFALAVIRQLRLRGLDDELVQLAVSGKTPEFIAVSAALALEQEGTSGARHRLADRLRASDASSLPDDVKAALIRATWPEHLSAETLFKIFTRPTDEVIGLYDVLSAEPFLVNLSVRDLPSALQWVESEPDHGYVPSNRQKLAAGIIELAAKNVSDAAVGSALVSLMTKTYSNAFSGGHSFDLLAPLYAHPEQARPLFVRVVNSVRDPEAIVQGAFWRAGYLVTGSLAWQLSQLTLASDQPRQRAWIWLIERTPARNKRELARLRGSARRHKELMPIAQAKVVVPQRKTGAAPIQMPNGKSTPEEGTGDITRQRLELALKHAPDNVQARLDVTDLVWQRIHTSEGTEPLWETLDSQLKARVNEFFATILSLPAVR